ncbi:hypothetical protein NQ317_017683 [Molorchus minor]|uniref:Uncharacterized protein n=1 Tax=Molorchus minor TaxID=1323400 RepID=A0ABQ9JQN3_9CUCU|nr:hypothetical protein NQ317_017683 [Molorchus minor]
MTENSAISFLLQLKDAVSAINLSENEVSTIDIPSVISLTETSDIAVIPSYGMEQVCIQPVDEIGQRNGDSDMEIESQNISTSGRVYKIVYPEELNLKANGNIKRGRPKKRKDMKDVKESVKAIKSVPRTRSGRLVNWSFINVGEKSQHSTGAQNNPDHGPVPHNEFNFDVWNYLVDITQKCPPSQRGIKFCEELTNLLHNVLLLTSALFKKAELDKNHVEVDKVLGNAIGLPPGPYKFNDSELYKDVTVLKLITNKSTDKECDVNGCSNNIKKEVIIKETVNEKVGKSELSFNFKQDVCSKSNNFSMNKTQVKAESENNIGTSSHEQNSNIHCGIVNSKSFIKENESLDDRIAVHADLLSENSLLSLPTLRNSVDDLIMSGPNLLDNSNSDEMMNVDQFVNERFKKITEPEMELSSNGLNLDLPSLDLFQFHNG